MKYIIGLVCIAAGLLVMIGTAGSSDLDLLSMGEIIKQLAAGLLLSGIGFLCCRDILED